MDITLVNFMNEQLSLVSLDFKRYMYEKLPWEARLVGLMGPRGVGKSTMILQRIKEMAEADQQQTLYIQSCIYSLRVLQYLIFLRVKPI